MFTPAGNWQHCMQINGRVEIIDARISHLIPPLSTATTDRRHKSRAPIGPTPVNNKVWEKSMLHVNETADKFVSLGTNSLALTSAFLVTGSYRCARSLLRLRSLPRLPSAQLWCSNFLYREYYLLQSKRSDRNSYLFLSRNRDGHEEECGNYCLFLTPEQ